MLPRHERTACLRRPLGGHRTAPAEGAAKTPGRPPGPRPARPRWHRLRPANPVPLAPDAQGPGLRQRLDLLAAASRLAGGRCLATIPRTALEPAWRRGRPRLVASERGFLKRPGQEGGRADRPNPTDRGKPGSTYRLAVDRNSIPLAVRRSTAYAHDATQLLLLVDAIPPVIGPRGKPGRPRKRPVKLHVDQAHESSPLRRSLRTPGVTPRVARRGLTRMSGWGGTGGWWRARSPACSAAGAPASATSPATRPEPRGPTTGRRPPASASWRNWGAARLGLHTRSGMMPPRGCRRAARRFTRGEA